MGWTNVNPPILIIKRREHIALGERVVVLSWDFRARHTHSVCCALERNRALFYTIFVSICE